MKIQLNKLLQAEIKALENIPINDNFEKAIKIIHSHIHEMGSKLVISGMGKAGQIGLNIATTFSSTGTPSVFLHPAEAQHGDLGILRSADVLLLISNSGRTREILELVQLSKNLISNNYKANPIVAITGNLNSPLAKEADVTLHTGGSPEICPLGLTPTTSTTCMSVIGDLLVVQMMQKIGFSKYDYALTHHSGYLGQKARNDDA